LTTFTLFGYRQSFEAKVKESFITDQHFTKAKDAKKGSESFMRSFTTTLKRGII